MARQDRSRALRLRLQGKSYSEIGKELGGISKSTLSLWLKNVILSDVAKQRLAKREREKSIAALIKRNQAQTAWAIRRKSKIKNSARRQIELLSKKTLLLLGAALYWAEGYKRSKMANGREITNHPVVLTNADPKLLQAFIKFVIEVCDISREKIKLEVRIFQHLHEETVIQYWSRTLQLPRENFSTVRHCISRSSQGKRPFNRLPYGVVQIRINNTNLFHKIMGWIDGMKEKI